MGWFPFAFCYSYCLLCRPGRHVLMPICCLPFGGTKFISWEHELVEIGWLPTNCLLFSHIFWSSEPSRCGLIPTCYLPCCGHTLLWSCEPSTDEFVSLVLSFAYYFCGFTLSLDEFSGDGLIPICRPSFGEHGLIPICCSPFGPT